MNLKFKSTSLSLGPSGRFFWIVISRLVNYGALFATYLLYLPTHGLIYQLLIIYGILAIGFLLYVLAFNRKPDENLVRFIVGLQTVFEFAFEAILVNRVGGNFSPLVVLFMLTIVSSSMIYGLVGTLISATIAGLFYAAPVIWKLSELLPGIFRENRIGISGIGSDEVFYTVFLHLCLFYLVAFISGYLAENFLFASRELQKIRLETNEILENMRSGMITVDNRGNIVYFNRAAGGILDIASDKARRTNYRDLFFNRYPELYYKIDLALSTGYVESRGEIEIKIGEVTVPLGISTSLLKDEERTRGVIVVFQNLSEAKLLERRLRDADRMASIGQLSAGIAHEIRNPLAAISGSVEVLRDSLKLEKDDERKLFDLILKESARLNRILTDFLSFSRVTGNIESKAELTGAIREVIDLAKAHPQYKQNIVFEIPQEGKTVFARGTPDVHKQLLWNLILNAIQAIGGNDGVIKIQTGLHVETGGRVWTKLEISDNGCGIPPNIRGHIFQPFYSTKTDGTGLGLAIVWRIVESLEGKISFDTGSWGTKFTVLIPPDADKSFIQREIQPTVGVW